MKRYVINLESVEQCKINLAQQRKDKPHYGIIDIYIYIYINKHTLNFKMIDMNDDFVAQSFSNLYCYEPFFMLNWIEYLNKTEGLIMDIGASTGLYSLISQSYIKNRDVYAFEPYPRAYSRLILNKDINCFPKIKIFPYAVSDYDGIGSLSVKNFEGPITTAGHISSDRNLINIPVQIKNIDNLINPDIKVGQIKIDCEGLEVQVLNTLKRIIEQWKPVVFFECLKQENFKKLSPLFDKLGYNILGILEEKRKLEYNILPNKHCTNFIASPKNID